MKKYGNWRIPPSSGHMDRDSGIYLQNMTTRAVEERLEKNDVIIIPIGSTESHGPHSPLGEDTFLVTRMAEAIAKRTGCTVAQPIWYGSHPYHHLGMPGTIVVPEDVFTAVIRCVIAGLWNTGFRKQILLNGHGQEYVIPTAIHQFAKTYQVPAVIVNLNWYYPIPEHVRDKEHGGPFETPFLHADEAETSFSLSLFPELMKMENAVDTTPVSYLPPGHLDKSGNAYQQPLPWYTAMGCWALELYQYPVGVVGKASLASADKAKPGLQALLDYMVKLHDDILEKFPPGILPPIEEMSYRSPEELEAVIKGPLNGGRHIYTIAYPP